MCNKTFIERIENKGYLGCIFELKFRSYFAAGGTLQMGRKTIRLEKHGYETLSSSCVPEVGVLYQPNKSNFHGLDFFFLAKKSKKSVLYMLQTTVSETTHGPLKFNKADIKGLISHIQGLSITITYHVIIYVLPIKKMKFKAPEPDNSTNKTQKAAIVIVGWPSTHLAGFE